MQTEAPKAPSRELEPTSTSSFENNSLKTWLTQFWQRVVRAMSPSDEPKVWHSKNWFGQAGWTVYLPKTGQTVRLSSEAEVRVWLEGHLVPHPLSRF
ncbi:hypothetical protein H6F89_28540 [Cyanobacteria bacterium FACHB-63]|nr:hypothetical protein [Cyanobacteria bacterium FACHB-63]